MRGLRLLVTTQTPLVRFREPSSEQASGQESRPLASLVEGEDYKFTTGGVTRMLLPLLRAWLREGRLSQAEWLALGTPGAPRLEHDGIRLSFVDLDASTGRQYARHKERMWALLNSARPPVRKHEDGWQAFEEYQERSARALADAAERMGGAADLAYVHDFQLIGVARAVSFPALPSIFHLHTPFPSDLPLPWARYFVERMEAYDAVIVSTRRYAENVRAAGYEGRLEVVHPFIDPAEQRAASAEDVARFRERFSIGENEPIVLNVGRMDPMKGQDRLLRAWPRVLERVPEARLVLVGNGSFSSSNKGGLGLSKGVQWRAALESLAADLHIQGRVTFTGHLGDDLLPAAYDASSVFCLPSTREGFGLAVIEAWRHGLPVVVSDRAGVSELVEEAVNGHALDCADPERLAAQLVSLLKDPEGAAACGKAGLAASERAILPYGKRELERIITSVLAKEAKPRATA